jgi:calcineurin-like phosphoesterase family protein
LKYWFTADTHFNHANILKYCNRPFKNINEHDYVLIKNWNSRVKPDDIVFHLGDFCFKETKDKSAKYYIDQLNGQIIFIAGNHDSHNGVKTCIQSIDIFLGGKHLMLVHKPEESAKGYDLCLVGHIHQHWKFQTLFFRKWGKWDVCNVGIDVWSGFPITINEILRAYYLWKKTGIQNLGDWHKPQTL